MLKDFASLAIDELVKNIMENNNEMKFISRLIQHTYIFSIYGIILNGTSFNNNNNRKKNKIVYYRRLLLPSLYLYFYNMNRIVRAK